MKLQMPTFTRVILYSVLIALSLNGKAQTELHGGDIIMLTMVANMEFCGLPPQSDELSFVCFKDIENGTLLDLTDNGWETAFANYWGDGEGTLRMTRTGGTIPAGTVITLQSQLIAGNWTYRTISPDNGWSFANLNIPGGAFNIDPGGDQVYFMQGGTWDNQGGGTNKAIYNGRIIYGANNHYEWAANGTTHESNLHPEVVPCYYNQPSQGLTYMDCLKYTGPTTSATHFEWLERMQWWPNWYTLNFPMCIEWLTFLPDFHVGASIPIERNVFAGCFVCDGCAPFDDALYLICPGMESIMSFIPMEWIRLKYSVFQGFPE